MKTNLKKSFLTAKKFRVNGLVQGVGFRPFIFNLAKKYELKGKVSNTSKGVLILVEGSLKNIESFSKDIYRKSPLLAIVENIEISNLKLQNFSSFKITQSKSHKQREALISPDISICADCLMEMNNPNDRRYKYPFINCTNCGPRYTIINDIPYDRLYTSMKHFKMCSECQKEYDNPLNRRFHAQPNACHKCGPNVFLTDNKGKKKNKNTNDAIYLATKFLKQGKILAIKGLGGFHLACNAFDSHAVQTLRRKKTRPDKPLALMAKSVKIISGHVFINKKEKNLLESLQRPIVLLKKKNNKACTKKIALDNNCLGIMLAYTGLHYLLFDKKLKMLVMTSGNKTNEPIAINNNDAINEFSHIADYFLFHNRDIYFANDDSIVKVQAKQKRFFRRARGYAPLPISLNKTMPMILGCGAEKKNTICLTKNNFAFLSPHIGTLRNMKTYEHYKKNIDHLKYILSIKPEIIAHDMHPLYMSTDFANLAVNKNIKKIAIQHHHAHAVSCMAENNLDQEVIAIVLDGTGYGTDGNIWGGEILLCTHKSFKRKAHLKYISMPGSDKAILEPWRMAASFLFDIFGNDFWNLKIKYLSKINKEKLLFLYTMIEKKINSPLTSSAGRLFDAIASLLDIKHRISYESQAAIKLETIAQKHIDSNIQIWKNIHEYTYKFNIEDKKTKPYQIDIRPCIKGIIKDLEDKLDIGNISVKFHFTLISAFVKAAIMIREQSNINEIVLSGGVLNNDIILKGLIKYLRNNDFKVYTHKKVPMGDGGISLGQVVSCAAFLKKL